MFKIKINHMKKVIISMLVCGAMLSATAQDSTGTSNPTTTTTTTTTTTAHKYFYYPSTNVYTDEATGNYWYWDKANSKWMMTQTLPTTITLDQTKYPVEIQGNDPWKNNDADIKKYKVKGNGEIKVKTEK